MKFQEKLLYSHIAFEELFDVNNPIHDKRLEALKVFEKKGFPSRKDEAWKYTSLNSLINKDYSLFPKKTLHATKATKRNPDQIFC